MMELLGPSLEKLLDQNKRQFSLKTVILIGLEILNRVEFLHNKDFIHRDLKPDNLLTSRNKKEKVIYLIDFGLSKRYRNNKTDKHIPFKEGKSLTGTARYSSINTHIGMEQSRRDDLECLAYIFLYFLRGDLPWQGLKAKNKKEKYAKIMEKKTSIDVNRLFKGYPGNNYFINFY